MNEAVDVGLSKELGNGRKGVQDVGWIGHAKTEHAGLEDREKKRVYA